MNRNNLISRVRVFIERLVGVFFILLGVWVMSNVSVAATEGKLDVGGSGEGFGVYGLGGHEYGMNTVAVWLSGKIRVMRADTIDNMDLHGVGIFDGRLSPDDLKLANDIHRQLCEAVETGPSNEVPKIDPPTMYDVDCLRDGKLASYQGPTNQLPRALFNTLVSFYSRTRGVYLGESRTVVKLDVEVASVERVKDKFLVAIRFVNSGQYPITMDTPDKWPKEMRYQLDFGGKNESGTSKWGGSFAGVPLVNESEFPDGKVVVPAKGSVTLEFLTLPDEKFTRGTYKFNVVVNAAVDVPGVAPGLGRVDFHSDFSTRVPFTFDRDWPSTPNEQQEYEARQREKMSLQPVYPGKTFAKDGYYLAVSSSTQRSRFMTAFRAGAVAPDMAAVVGEQGEAIYGRYPGWVWYADLGAPVRCRPGDVCPRNGRWFARVESFPVWPITYEDDLNEVIECRVGVPLPQSRRATEWSRDRVHWEWIGM
ncbi:hypothetical protein HT746_25770 [Burkholderia pyrrocinia]|uniref:hypothetical protein n=1 Tax=Burkholderia pyrrocinia TaxID=60550 RepID=UPI0015764367|nr:hypothetical protein [Burkholderia pyrrocinia]NTX30485.1 hypothetical protein [Burkholderia pyrrocinia]